MRKLLSLNSLLLILAIGKCGSDKVVKTQETQPVQDTLTEINEIVVTDSFGNVIGVVVDTATQTVIVNPGSKEDKYNSRPHNPKEAPKHDAPDQAKIDSIKAAKAKGKK